MPGNAPVGEKIGVYLSAPRTKRPMPYVYRTRVYHVPGVLIVDQPAHSSVVGSQVQCRAQSIPLFWPTATDWQLCGGE